MTPLPSLKPREFVSLLQKLGWRIARQRGSHIQLKHSEKPNFRVTIPFHNSDLSPGTLSSIIKQMGITKSQFEELLKNN